MARLPKPKPPPPRPHARRLRSARAFSGLSAHRARPKKEVRPIAPGSRIAHGPVDTCVATMLNDAVLYLIKLTSRFNSARNAPSIRPAMKTGINLMACQGGFLRQFLLGASGFYLYPKEAQNFAHGGRPLKSHRRPRDRGKRAPTVSYGGRQRPGDGRGRPDRHRGKHMPYACPCPRS
jgi:hypothetical protein